MALSGYVLDATVAVVWCFDDEGAPAAWALLERLRTESGHVPALWALEVGNILPGAEKRERITPARVVEFLAILADLDIRVDPDAPGRVLRDVLPIARARGFTTCDASYPELAMRLGLPLETEDRALARAAAATQVATLPA